VRVLVSACALVAAIACSDSPTAPTREVDLASQLSWRVLATSCGVSAAPSPQPEFSAARLTTQPDGSLTASWPYVQNGREMILHARLIRENGAWAVCSWDTADV
jgi:hypothetical protein